MALTFVALRSAVFAAGFFWLWIWIALLLRPLDDMFGGPFAGWSAAAAWLALVPGGAIAGWCIVAFIVHGRGTPALFDPPRRLVAIGPYRYVRNPMYVGGALLLLGFGLYQQSPSIVLLVAPWWLLFHLLVVLYEEVALRHQFGSDYDAYCRRTPRWIPRFARPAVVSCAALAIVVTLLQAADPKPNFSGEWKLDAGRSDFGPLPGMDRRTDRIEHAEPSFRLTSTQVRGDRESVGEWTCRTDGSPCTVSMRGADLKVATKIAWDGPALAFESKGTYGGGDVRMSDRWTLSPDGKTLTIARVLSSDLGEAQQTVVLQKQ